MHVHPAEDPLRKLIRQLVWAFDRDGVFFIGYLEGENSPEQVSCILQQELERRSVPVRECILDPQDEKPFHRFEQTFRQVSTGGQRTVLLVWCLEHLVEKQTVDTLQWLNRRRDSLSRGKTIKGDSIPIVLLIHETMYASYFAHWAGDLADSLPAPFRLSLSPQTGLLSNNSEACNAHTK